MNNTARVYAMDGWTALGQAIVKQSVDDWRMAQRRRRNPHLDTNENAAMIRECESFLRSPTPEYLTNVHGPYILKKLKEELSA